MPNHPDIGTSLNNLGCILQDLNKTEEAEENFREALSFRKAYLSPNHPDIGISMNNIAGVLIIQNRLTEAEVLYRKTLDFRK